RYARLVSNLPGVTVGHTLSDIKDQRLVRAGKGGHKDTFNILSTALTLATVGGFLVWARTRNSRKTSIGAVVGFIVGLVMDVVLYVLQNAGPTPINRWVSPRDVVPLTRPDERPIGGPESQEPTDTDDGDTAATETETETPQQLQTRNPFIIPPWVHKALGLFSRTAREQAKKQKVE
ncbi:hypothetical protein KIPB_013936, partial [Kipferlia bialata]